MNWFQRLWNNPNLHVAVGTAAAIATQAFPAYAVPLTAVAGVLGASGIMLPEQAPLLKDKPAPSMHAQDYAALAAAIAEAMQKK